MDEQLSDPPQPVYAETWVMNYSLLLSHSLYALGYVKAMMKQIKCQYFGHKLNKLKASSKLKSLEINLYLRVWQHHSCLLAHTRDLNCNNCSGTCTPFRKQT